MDWYTSGNHEKYAEMLNFQKDYYVKYTVL